MLASFALTTPTDHRKRALGDPIKWEPGRQARSGATAVAAGYQIVASILVAPLIGPSNRARRLSNALHQKMRRVLHE